MKFTHHRFLSHRSLGSGVAMLGTLIFLMPFGRLWGGMVPADLSVVSSAYGANYTNVAIGDAGAAVASVINLTGAPAGSIVTGVDVGFDVGHEYPGDLRVTLVATNKSGQQPGLVLWTPGDRSANGYLSAAALTDFNGAAANQSWQLVVQDTRAGQVGYLDQWSLRVRYLTPPQLRGPGTAGATGFLIGTTTPALQWNPAPGATRYRLRAQRSPYDAASTVFETLVNGAAGSFTLPPGRLAQNRSYRWTATSLTSSGTESGFGAPLFFATPATGALLPPAQIGPGNSGDNNRAFLPNDPPVFQWQGVVGAVGYKVRVSEYPYDAGNEVLTQTVGLATSFTPVVGSLIPGVRYRWTVTALYPGGESTPWEEAQYFEISDPNAPQISSAVSANATRGSAFNYTITATNSPTSFGAVDLLAGLSVNTVTGLISGTPTLTGAQNVMVKAFNAVGGSNRLVIMDVRPPVPVVTSTGSTSAVLGRPFSYRTVTTENPTSYGATNLTAGLTLDPDSGLITGAVTTAGNYTIILSATHSGGTGTKNLSLSVASGPPYDTKLAPSGVHENQPVGTVVGNFDTLDGDPGQTFTYTLVAGAGAEDNALFQIFTGEAALRTGAVFDYETRNTYSIRVRTTDNSGQFLDKQITVRVLNVIGEVQGGLRLSDATVYENRPAGALVGYLSGVDPDPGETFTFALINSGPEAADNGKFQIVDNQLRTSVSLNMEAQRFYTIRIRVTDSGNNTLEELAVIEVLDDLNEDFDDDGLTQAQESALGTSDLQKDADGDGASDGAEAEAGTSPLDGGSFPDGTLVVVGAAYDHLGVSNTGITTPGPVQRIVDAAAGYLSSVAVKSDGAVLAWGQNGSGQCNLPPNLGAVAQVSAGATFTLYLQRDGVVRAAGSGLGVSSLPAGLNNVVFVSAGEAYGLALKGDGTVIAWGDNKHYAYHTAGDYSGQTDIPANVQSGDIVSLSAGRWHGFALGSSGRLFGWGFNAWDGYQFVAAPSSVTQGSVAAVAGGGEHSIALLPSGAPVSWGRTFNNQFDLSAFAAPVLGVAGTGWGNVLLKADGSVGGTGYSAYGTAWVIPTGLNRVTRIASGCLGVHFLALRGGTAPVITSPLYLSGTVGSAFVHQLQFTGGANMFRAMNLPAGLTLNPTTGEIAGAPTQAGRFWVRIFAERIAPGSASRGDKIIIFNIASAGVPPTDIALAPASIIENLASGSVVGSLTTTDTDEGQSFSYSLINSGPEAVENGKFTVSGSQLQTLASFDYETKNSYTLRLRVTDSGGHQFEKTITVAILDDTGEDDDGDGLTQAQEVAMGTNQLIADTDGDGANDGAEVTAGTNPLDANFFPDGTLIALGGGDRPGPYFAGTIPNPGQKVPSSVSATVDASSGYLFSVALKVDGIVHAWGLNDKGQCNQPAGLGPVAQVSAGAFDTMYLQRDGTVKVAGTSSTLSQLPAGLTNVIAIASGGDYGLALKGDGSLVAWGHPEYGQLVLPPAAQLQDTVALSAGNKHTMTLSRFGRLNGWGTNPWGSSVSNFVPAPAEIYTTSIVSVSPESDHTLALAADGRLFAWGWTTDSQCDTTGLPAGIVEVTATGQGSVYRTESGLLTARGSYETYAIRPYVNWVNPIVIPAWLNRVTKARFGASATTLLVLRGNANPDVTSPSLVQGGVGAAFSHQITATGTPTNFWTMNLPPGLMVNAATGEITGTPTQSGRFFCRVFAERSGPGSAARGDKVIIFSIGSGGSAPTDLAVTPASIVENRPTNSVVGTLSATDANAGDTFTFWLINSGPEASDNAKFNIAGNQLRTSAAFDYEAKNSYTIRVRVVDAAGNEFERPLTIAVADDTTEDDDGDGLTQEQELAVGTNPLLKDTDGDGAMDGAEVAAGTNPLDPNVFPDGTLVALSGGDRPRSNGTYIPNPGLIIPGDVGAVVDASSGDLFSVVAKADGTVRTWGLNTQGQCNIPVGLGPVARVAAGQSHVLYLLRDGTVRAAGSSAAVSGLPAGLSGVVAIASGANYGMALKVDGSVVAWGHTEYGQLNLPAAAQLHDVVSISAGLVQSNALSRLGRLHAWGTNPWGSAASGNVAAPANIATTNIARVSSGGLHTLAITASGQLLAWGKNNVGQCNLSGLPANIVDIWTTMEGSVYRTAGGALAAHGDYDGYSFSQYFGLSDPIVLPNWLDRVTWANYGASGSHLLLLRGMPPPVISSPNFLQGTVGAAFSHQIIASGSPTNHWAMGLPSGLSINAATGEIIGTPTQAGRFFCRVFAERTRSRGDKVMIFSIGSGGSAPTDLALSPASIFEEKPVGTAIGALSATDADAGDAFTYSLINSGPEAEDNAKFTISGSQLLAAVSFDFETKTSYTIRLRAVDAAGNEFEKPLSITIIDDTLSDDDADGLTQAQELTLGTNPLNKDTDSDGAMDGAEVAAGTNPLDPNSFPDGTLVALGSGGRPGPGGPGNTDFMPNPGEIVPGTLRATVDATTGFFFSVAVKDDGTVTTWGQNNVGQCNIPGGLGPVAQVSAGTNHVLYLLRDGTVRAAGLSPAVSALPAGLSNVVSIASGPDYALALRGNGSIVAWGDNAFGQVTLPPASELTDVVALATGEKHAMALGLYGRLTGWGVNPWGINPINNGQYTRAPGSVASTAFSAVAVGANHTIAVSSGGQVSAWGWGANGQCELGGLPADIVELATTTTGSVYRTAAGVIAGKGAYEEHEFAPYLGWHPPIIIPAWLDRAVRMHCGASGRHLLIERGAMAPQITSSALSVATLGAAFSYQITTTGSPNNFWEMGLPPGLSLDASTGAVIGTPTQTGRYLVRLFAERNATGSASRGDKIVIINVGSGLPPTAIGLTSGVVAEDVPVGTIVARMLTDDPDLNPPAASVGKGGDGLRKASVSNASTETFTYTLVAGPGDTNNGLFAIVGDALVTAAALDYEGASALSVRVRVTDSGGNILDRTLALNVLDVPEGETLANWQTRLGVTDLEVDGDADGMNGLLEWALGTPTGQPNGWPVEAAGLEGTGGGGLLVRFPRSFGGLVGPNGSYTYAGVTYWAEWSLDGVTWSGQGMTEISSAPAPGYPSGYRLVTLRTPGLAPGQSRQFVRVRVQKN